MCDKPIDPKFCNQADQFCDAPAGWGTAAGIYTSTLDDPQAQFSCDDCGDDNCGDGCSDVRDLGDGLGERRLCHDCQIRHDGNDVFVMRKLVRLAGYPVAA
jgi:hypothetical protein